MAADMCVRPYHPRLYYVMGPSGAGKDSLIGFCRPRLAGKPVAFAHRYITRPAEAGGENHVALSDSEFAARALAGCFAMQWHSHDLMYGVGIEIDAWMERGMSVVVNGSRQYLPQAAERYPGIIPVAVTVDLACLRKRLEQRGRETAEQIEERLAKAGAFRVDHPALVTIDNSGHLENAGAQMMAVFTGNDSSVQLSP